MSDNKASSSERRDRSGGADDPDREVQVLMKRTDCSYSQVLALIHRYGHDQARIEQAASRLRST